MRLAARLKARAHLSLGVTMLLSMRGRTLTFVGGYRYLHQKLNILSLVAGTHIHTDTHTNTQTDRQVGVRAMRATKVNMPLRVRCKFVLPSTL